MEKLRITTARLIHSPNNLNEYNQETITPDELERIQAKVQGSETITQSLSERLNQLQDAYSQGLITQDEYVAKRRDILDNA